MKPEVALNPPPQLLIFVMKVPAFRIVDDTSPVLLTKIYYIVSSPYSYGFRT